MPATGREPLLREVVRIIAGTPTADVFKFLCATSEWIKQGQKRGASRPTTGAIRTDLKDIERMAGRLARLLDEDGWSASYLHHAKTPFGAWPIALTSHLLDISERAQLALAQIPENTGRARPTPMRGGMPAAKFTLSSPEVICATLISEAWRHARNSDPAATNENAGLACSLLWQAVGGRASANDSRWPRHLRAAQAIDKAPGNGIDSSFRNHLRSELANSVHEHN